MIPTQYENEALAILGGPTIDLNTWAKELVFFLENPHKVAESFLGNLVSKIDFDEMIFRHYSFVFEQNSNY